MEDINFDWCDHDVLGPVETIIRGICWARMAASSVESGHHIINKPSTFTRISAQHIVDCYDAYKDDFTSHGHVGKAFKYIIEKNEGMLYNVNDYPRDELDRRGICKSAGLKPSAIIVDSAKILRDEVEMKRVVKLQPITAVISSTSIFKAKQKSKRGIVMYKDVDWSDALDHYVLIVGYGVDEIGINYWKCQNSWGAEWGEDGFFRIERNTTDPRGTAGIARSVNVENEEESQEAFSKLTKRVQLPSAIQTVNQFHGIDQKKPLIKACRVSSMVPISNPCNSLPNKRKHTNEQRDWDDDFQSPIKKGYQLRELVYAHERIELEKDVGNRNIKYIRLRHPAKGERRAVKVLDQEDVNDIVWTGHNLTKNKTPAHMECKGDEMGIDEECGQPYC
ncbi:hypothetical protein QVD17_21107 [Tagetes erecta]|uniref:Peptidase C1A papain C-terminal domain-containing protein n=1 Tax=Tagetes erecta TaxID=13708 RepID=A0AAD8KR43_TARER|nr:hypothetical protein QVD17_21107 [Tagetes erecta]